MTMLSKAARGPWRGIISTVAGTASGFTASAFTGAVLLHTVCPLAFCIKPVDFEPKIVGLTFATSFTGGAVGGFAVGARSMIIQPVMFGALFSAIPMAFAVVYSAYNSELRGMHPEIGFRMRVKSILPSEDSFASSTVPNWLYEWSKIPIEANKASETGRDIIQSKFDYMGPELRKLRELIHGTQKEPSDTESNRSTESIDSFATPILASAEKEIISEYDLFKQNLQKLLNEIDASESISFEKKNEIRKAGSELLDIQKRHEISSTTLQKQFEVALDEIIKPIKDVIQLETSVQSLNETIGSLESTAKATNELHEKNLNVFSKSFEKSFEKQKDEHEKILLETKANHEKQKDEHEKILLETKTNHEKQIEEVQNKLKMAQDGYNESQQNHDKICLEATTQRADLEVSISILKGQLQQANEVAMRDKSELQTALNQLQNAKETLLNKDDAKFIQDENASLKLKHEVSKNTIENLHIAIAAGEKLFLEKFTPVKEELVAKLQATQMEVEQALNEKAEFMVKLQAAQLEAEQALTAAMVAEAGADECRMKQQQADEQLRLMREIDSARALEIKEMKSARDDALESKTLSKETLDKAEKSLAEIKLKMETLTAVYNESIEAMETTIREGDAAHKEKEDLINLLKEEVEVATDFAQYAQDALKAYQTGEDTQDALKAYQTGEDTVSTYDVTSADNGEKAQDVKNNDLDKEELEMVAAFDALYGNKFVENNDTKVDT